jgi:hypothetical protein
MRSKMSNDRLESLLLAPVSGWSANSVCPADLLPARFSRSCPNEIPIFLRQQR